jgi:hypothetical protein
MSFVAISKVRYPSCLKDQIHEFCLEMLPMAKLQPGFISIRFHQSSEMGSGSISHKKSSGGVASMRH